MENNNSLTEGSTPSYSDWLIALKSRVQQVQTKAAVSVNRELLSFYWELGCDIIEKQKTAIWGSGFLKRLSADLSSEFPQIKGFSHRNIKYIRQWCHFYLDHFPHLATNCCQVESDSESVDDEQVTNGATSCCPIVAQAVPQFLNDLVSIPWGHNIAIISKCPTHAEALYYVRQTLAHGWSRAVLVHQIESDLFSREGSAISSYVTPSDFHSFKIQTSQWSGPQSVRSNRFARGIIRHRRNRLIWAKRNPGSY